METVVERDSVAAGDSAGSSVRLDGRDSVPASPASSPALPAGCDAALWAAAAAQPAAPCIASWPAAHGWPCRAGPTAAVRSASAAASAPACNLSPAAAKALAWCGGPSPAASGCASTPAAAMRPCDGNAASSDGRCASGETRGGVTGQGSARMGGGAGRRLAGRLMSSARTSAAAGRRAGSG